MSELPADCIRTIVALSRTDHDHHVLRTVRGGAS
jgi:hypothetical protein